MTCQLPFHLVVIDNLDVFGPVVPTKAYPPLVVDTYAVLALSVPHERLQAIPGWASKVIEARGGGKHFEFPACDALEALKPPDEPIL